MITNLIGGTITKKLNNNMLMNIIVLILLILLKVFLVQWSYNKIYPLLVRNTTGNENVNFKPLNLSESFILVILFSSIF